MTGDAVLHIDYAADCQAKHTSAVRCSHPWALSGHSVDWEFRCTSAMPGPLERCAPCRWYWRVSRQGRVQVRVAALTIGARATVYLQPYSLSCCSNVSDGRRTSTQSEVSLSVFTAGRQATDSARAPKRVCHAGVPAAHVH